MSVGRQIGVYGTERLQPYIYPEMARTIAVNLAPGSYRRGQAMGELSTVASEIQTITPSGTWSAGTYTIAVNGEVSATIAYNASASVVNAALLALGSVGPGDVTVTGGPLSAGAFTLTFGANFAGVNVSAIVIDTTAVTGVTPAAVVATTVQGSGGIGTFTKYADANVDGSGVFRAFLEYDCEVDGAGFVAYGDSRMRTASVFIAGFFYIADVIGFDAAAMNDVNGSVVQGSITSGVIRI